MVNEIFSAEMNRRTLLGVMAAAGVTVLAGCSAAQSTKPATSGKALASDQTIVVLAPETINSLDPAFVNNGSYVTPLGLYEGLVRTNDAGTDVVPAIADTWTISGDKLTYTFHIRANAKFSNGDPITANDFLWTYKRLLTATGAGGGGTLGTNAYKPSMGIVGATDYLSGALTDFSKVGVKAKDDQHLAITLSLPNSAFLLGLTNVAMSLLHPPTVEKFPQDWMQPANWVGSGPYTLTGWSPTASLTMKKHDHYWDAKKVHITAATARVITDPNQSLLAYRNNEIVVAGAAISTFNKDKTLMSQVVQAGGYSVYYLQNMFSSHPAASKTQIRQALSLAINRQALAKITPGTVPGTALVPDSVPGWPKSLALPYDPAKAKKLLSDAGYPGGKGLPTIQILSSASYPGVEAILSMWQELGIKTKDNVVDGGQYVATRQQVIQDPNLWGYYYGSFGGLPTWNNWLIDLWNGQNLQFFSLPADKVAGYYAIQKSTSIAGAAKAQQLSDYLAKYASSDATNFANAAKAAAAEVSDSKRVALFTKAAQMRQSMYLQLPLMWGVSAFLVAPTVSGLHVNYNPNGYYLNELKRVQ